jgi:chorismate mutase
MAAANNLDPADIASAIFTVTPDLDAAFPAQAARKIGWDHVPLLDTVEIGVPGSLPRCIRVLVNWNTDQPPYAVRHIYLREAVGLRPDLQSDLVDSDVPAIRPAVPNEKVSLGQSRTP